MKLIKPSYLILDQKPGLDGIYEQIELAGRTCYKSARPEGQTAKDFVDRMITSQHYAMLEHGTVYLKIPYDYYKEDSAPEEIIDFYRDNPYSTIIEPIILDNGYPAQGGYQMYYVTTNYRVLVENLRINDLQYLCEPTEYHEKRVTVRFTTDRGVSHEFVRHRVFSFAQESTRYCNYSKDKFGNELTFIIPSWCSNKDEITVTPNFCDIEWDDELRVDFGPKQGQLYVALIQAEYNYFKLLELGWTPQQARQVLPNALKTELVMTGFISDWQHLFRLRTSFIAETGKPHPDMANLCDPLYKEFIKRNLINNIIWKELM